MRRLIIVASIVLVILVLTGVYLSYRQQEQPVTTHGLVLYGNVDIRQVDLGFQVKGRVDAMPFQEGERVTKGTLIASLDKEPYADQVRQAAASLEVIRISLTNAERLLKRRQELVQERAVAQEDFENAMAARDILEADMNEAEAVLGVAQTKLNDTNIYAPADGSILTRIREPGAVVREADAVYTLSLDSPVWIRAFVSEQELGLVKPGMHADVFTDTPGGKVYLGHVGFISPVAEFTPKTVETIKLRTDLVYRLRIIADNPDQGLRQGMPVTVRICP